MTLYWFMYFIAGLNCYYYYFVVYLYSMYNVLVYPIEGKFVGLIFVVRQSSAKTMKIGLLENSCYTIYLIIQDDRGTWSDKPCPITLVSLIIRYPLATIILIL